MYCVMGVCVIFNLKCCYSYDPSKATGSGRVCSKRVRNENFTDIVIN
jgi:hypothetical protein